MKSLPKFGFDIDGVMLDTFDIIALVAREKYGVRLLKSEQIRYKFEEVTGLTKEQVVDCVTIAINNSMKVRPIMGSVQFIKKYYADTEMPPIFITSRKPDTKPMRDITTNWLSMYLHPIPFEVIFSSEKSVECEYKGIDVFVEDRARTALDIAKSRKVIIFDYPWNRHLPPRDNIYRVSSWKDIDVVWEWVKADRGFKKKIGWEAMYV